MSSKPEEPSAERVVKRVAAWLFAGCVGCAMCMGTALLAPQVPFAPHAAFALGFACVSAEIVVLAYLAPRLRRGWLGSVLVGSALALSALAGAQTTGVNAGLSGALLLWAATALGAALGQRIEKPGHLLAVVIVAGIADLWSVYDAAGPSARLAASVAANPDRLPVFALCFPLLGTAHIPALVGAGDVLFCALYLAVFARHKLCMRCALCALSAAFVCALCVLLATQRALPLLPLLGAAVLCADRRVRELSTAEQRTVGAVAVALMAALVLRQVMR